LQEAVLYQFSLCPFCSKVRAGLELKGIPYRLVEVNPRSKAELPTLPDNAPRKVPVLTVGGLGGKLETGRALDYFASGDDGRKLCSLYLGIMDRMGVELPEFGDARNRLADF